MLASGGGNGIGASLAQQFTPVNWPIAWNLALQHNGVPGGGALLWKWTVRRIFG